MALTTAAIVVAAGEGRRIGGDTPKAYLSLGGRAMILRTLDKVFAVRRISTAVVVVAAEALSRCEDLLRGDSALGSRPWTLQVGGSTRQESVRRGLDKLQNGIEIVAIHDGARPFASTELFDRLIDIAVEKGAVVPGLPPRDTIKFVRADGSIELTPARSGLREIQTPQVFRRELIQQAHQRAARESFEATDDAMVVERLGEPVYVVEGEKLNFKVTLPEDVWLAETLIREGKMS